MGHSTSMSSLLTETAIVKLLMFTWTSVMTMISEVYCFDVNDNWLLQETVLSVQANISRLQISLEIKRLCMC